ncbi:MAG: hypothetical protein ACREBQ_14145 [Nitrososphaerales archaeon]
MADRGENYMKDELIDKIRQTLTSRITSEAHVVYLLVEIRKLMDRDKQGASPFETLRLYCNWVAHIELDRGQAEKIVRMADALYSKLLEGKLDPREKDEFRQLFMLTTFRTELARFLKAYGLRPLADSQWNVFLGYFLGVIRDCPLVCRMRKPAEPLKAASKRKSVMNVDEVVLIGALGDAHRIPDENAPPITWALCFNGVHKCTLEANFIPASPR